MNELHTVPLWRLGEPPTSIERVFRFRDFAAAWAFMNRVAALAEAMDHHPDWSNSFNRVTIRLSTHDIGGLGPKDWMLAQRIDAVVAE